MDRKKILWLCSWYPSKADPFNGDFIQRHAQAASLYNDITVIHVYADRGERAPKLLVQTNAGTSLKEMVISFRKNMSVPGRLRAHLKLISFYKKAIEEHIRANGMPDLVHVHVPVWAGMAALWLKRKYDIPFIVTEHWGIYNEIEVNNFRTKSLRFRKATKRIFRESSAFLSVSRFIAEGVNRDVLKKEYEVFPNVTDTDHFFPINKQREVFRFIHVSTMVALKNAEAILRVFDDLIASGKTAELVMVGPAPDTVTKLAASSRSAAGSIRFTGEISYKAVGAEMQTADCLLLFSNIENSPCVIGEALCCGLPVISSEVGGIPELVNNSNGILIPSGNETALLQAMTTMIDDIRSFDTGKIAAEAKEKFSYQSVGKKMDEAYRRIRP
jgi:glycosyltransferase involved in cell wall biosynthesis